VAGAYRDDDKGNDSGSVYVFLYAPPGITVTPTSGITTTEAGGTASFTVVLDASPTADVTIDLSSSDTTKGTVSPGSLTFTTGNWFVPRTVTVTGVDDGVAGGNLIYTIVTDPAESMDGEYDGLNADDVTVTNVDDETAYKIIDNGGGPCFIATAAYGSPSMMRVTLLREFRDRFMLTNRVGPMLVNLYYVCSPPVAEVISKHESIKSLVRWSLLPLVGISYVAINYGPGLTVFVILAFLSLMIFLFVLFRRRLGSTESIVE
jgi:hypothetical protein